MKKLKLDFSKVGLYVKVALIGIVSTLVGVLIFSVVLKFIDVSSKAISYINDLIKGLSIFVMVLCLKKASENNLLIKAIITSVIYSILCYIVFSILNGKLVFNMSLIYDILFGAVVAVIVSVIVNILKRKTM